MEKRITIELPSYLKKFFLFEYDGFQTQKAGQDPRDEIKVAKTSELGKQLQLIIQPIPFLQQYEPPKGSGALTINYTTRGKIDEVDIDRLAGLIRVMDETFRRTLIAEVRGIHALTRSDYSPFIEAFLERRGIIRDVEIEFETARKIYRDYMDQLSKKRQKTFA
jgi:hypothetical protein